MYFYRVKIAYKGSAYFGWQAQALDTTHEEKPTVEGTLLNSLKKITHYQPCTVSCASRTDAGVHAQGQLAKLTLPLEIEPVHLLSGLNSLLPADIRVLECSLASQDYQPSQSSLSKEYHYYFSLAPIENVATADIAMHVPSNESEPVDLDLMRAGCQLFTGQHDFYNFFSGKLTTATSQRRISYCAIHQANFSPLAEDIYYLKIIGDGFLKHMIRYLVGALLELSKGNITMGELALFLQEHQENKLSAKVKAKGLHLISIQE